MLPSRIWNSTTRRSTKYVTTSTTRGCTAGFTIDLTRWRATGWAANRDLCVQEQPEEGERSEVALSRGGQEIKRFLFQGTLDLLTCCHSIRTRTSDRAAVRASAPACY